LIRRIAGVVTRPRSTLQALVRAPSWLSTWTVILIVWGICGAALLSTDVGRQALVDERVRVVESLGGTISDADYAMFQARPPWWIYFTSGNRLWLSPLVTLLVAVGIQQVARAGGSDATFSQALAIVVHASVVLAVGQLVATPLHYVRESLTNPTNLASVLPAVDEGTLAARFFGSIDLFVTWWAGLLAIGLSTLTGRPARGFAVRLAAGYVVLAATVAAVIAAMGGA
jgi:hypothetical protein